MDMVLAMVFVFEDEREPPGLVVSRVIQLMTSRFDFAGFCAVFPQISADISVGSVLMNSQPPLPPSIIVIDFRTATTAAALFCISLTVDSPSSFQEMLHQTVAKRFVERRKSSFVPTDPQMTLVVLGASKVGKSSMVSQFLWHGFDAEYKPTVEEFHWIEYDRGQDNLFTLQVIDSSGSHDFLAMRQLYYRTGDAFIVVYGVDNGDSYTEAKEIITQLVEVRERKTPIVLVANKIDKRPSWKDKEAHMFATRMGINFAMITATEEEQVGNVFKSLVDQLKDDSALPELSQLKKRRQSMPTSSRGSRVSSYDVEQFNQRDNKRSCTIS